MKIIELRAENIKRLVAVEIKPDGNLVKITGANGVGKSSVLDAIWWALAGVRSHQPEPIRDGEEQALIELDLGEVVVKRAFKRVVRKLDDEEDGKTEEDVITTLKVETAKGARFPSPQAMLDKLLDSLSFDPLEFSRMDSRAQYQALKTLVGLDFTDLEVRSTKAYEERRDHNRRAKEHRAAAGQIELPDEVPVELVDVAAVAERMRAGERANAALVERERQLVDLKAAVREAGTRVELATHDEQDAQEALSKAVERRQALQKECHEAEEAVAAFPDVPERKDLTSLHEKITSAEAKNAIHRRAQEKARLAGEATIAEGNASKCTDIIDDCASRMTKMIAEADMPVPGLGFVGDEVTFNGHPFQQASDAEQLRVSSAIAMRSNQELRVIRIRQGSLLDEHGLEMLREMADKANYQVWIEIVDTSGAMGFVIEDGYLKGAGRPEGDLFDGDAD